MKTLFTLVALTLTTSAFAADAYTCKSSSGTAEVTVLKTKLKIRADADAAQLFGKKEVSASIDDSYKPRKEHEGSLRFDGSNDCGSYQVIIDKNMAKGKDNGRLTFQQDCDSDGTGPSWTVFDCR